MPKSLVAKMRLNHISRHFNGQNVQEDIELSAVTGAENEQWARWTPSGSLKLAINNPEAQGVLIGGHEYMITITPVED